MGWDCSYTVWLLISKLMQSISLILALRQGKIDERSQGTYDGLCEIRNQLERLSLTQAWSLRETDLYNYQRRLDRVDESRINGNFEDSEGNKADLHAQRVWAITVLEKRQSTRLTTTLDITLPPSTQLCLHLQLNHLVRACLWGASTDI